MSVGLRSLRRIFTFINLLCSSANDLLRFFIVEDIQLSQSTLPSEGFVKLFTKDDGDFAVCKSSLENVKDNVCHFLGYPKADEIRGQTSGSSMSKAGEVNCRATVAPSFLCTVTPNVGCNEYSILKCKFREQKSLIFQYFFKIKYTQLIKTTSFFKEECYMQCGV